MKQIYRTVIHGQILESDSLRQLLARAVAEKRELDRRTKTAWEPIASSVSAPRSISPVVSPAFAPEKTKQSS